jgi:hypothetical protein
MNYTLIILGVILIVVIYMMYSVILGQQSKIGANIITISSVTANNSVLLSSLATPNSPRYNLSFWISAENLAASEQSLFKISDPTKVAPANKDLLNVKLTTDATLKYSMSHSGNANETNHTIMTNFPFQKWVYVILSVDSNIMDMYIDGKLTRSEKFTITPDVPSKTYSIIFPTATANTLIYLARFERNPVAMDPATAWSKYMAGNGGNYFSSLFSSYGAAFTITKDNLEVNKLSLF